MAESPSSSDPRTLADKRFLAVALEWALALGVFSEDKILRRFPLRVVMRALSYRPEIRSNVLDAAGLDHRPGESAAALGDRITRAIECGEAQPRRVLEALPLDDCAKHLPHVVPLHDIWSFLLSADPEPSTDVGRTELFRAYVHFLLDRGVAAGVIQAHDLSNAEVLEPILCHLSRAELETALRWALRGAPPSELLIAFPLPYIACHAPLDAVWKRVIRPSLLSALRRTEPAPKLTFEFIDIDDEDLVTASHRGRAEALQVLAVDAASDADTAAERSATVAALAAVGRLPPHHELLPLTVLSGLERLYWQLLSAESPSERVDIFHTSFSSRDELRVALMALLPVFFPDESVPSRLGSTDHLVEIIEAADRQILERQHAAAARGTDGSSDRPQPAMPLQTGPLQTGPLQTMPPRPLPLPAMPLETVPSERRRRSSGPVPIPRATERGWPAPPPMPLSASRRNASSANAAVSTDPTATPVVSSAEQVRSFAEAIDKRRRIPR